jgi:hypothetical protein
MLIGKIGPCPDVKGNRSPLAEHAQEQLDVRSLEWTSVLPQGLSSGAPKQATIWSSLNFHERAV